MLSLAGRPLIGHQVEALSRAGVREIIINLHHLGEQIADYLQDGSRFDVAITYSWETELLETGGGIVKALPFFADQPFWLLNGDIFTDFDFSTLPVRPNGNNLAHIVLTPTPAYRDQGDFEYAGGQVSARGQRYVYCGIAVLDPRLLQGAQAEHFSIRDSYFALLQQGRLGAQVHRGIWQDIGSLAQYEAARSMAAAVDGPP